MSADKHFAQYCCELLASVGPCVPKRMFGGYGISANGLTLAIIADVGAGEKLWLKGDADTRSRYEAAGCVIFIYDMKGTPRSMNYFTAPEDAMDSPDAMRPWAALALACAVRAQAGKRKPAAQSKAQSAAKNSAKAPDASSAKPAPSKLSHTVLERAREAAKKLAVSTSLPTPKPSKPAAKRASAPAPNTTAARKSAKGAKTAAQ